MGLYDEHVNAFVDLRDAGRVKKKRKYIGKYGVEPQYSEAVDQVMQHILQERKKTLGENARPRIGASWPGTVQNLLRGTTSRHIVFTADQLCDLFDFATQDPFWNAHVQDPAGLARHGHKLWVKDEYIMWSIRNNRPEANRPRNVPTNMKGNFRGQLLADTVGEPSGWGGDI